MYGSRKRTKSVLLRTISKVTKPVYNLRSTISLNDKLKQFATTQRMKRVMKVVGVGGGRNNFIEGNIDKIDYSHERITIKYKRSSLGWGMELPFDDIKTTLIFLNDDKTIYNPKCGYLSDKLLMDRFKVFSAKYSEKIKDSYSSSEKKQQRKRFVEESYKEHQKNPDKMILYLETEDCIVTKQLLDARIPLRLLRPCNNDDLICEMIQQKNKKIRVLKEDIKKVFQANPNDYCSIWFDMEEKQSTFGDPLASSSFKGFIMINFSTRNMKATDVAQNIREKILRNSCNVISETYQGRSGITNMACGWGHM